MQDFGLINNIEMTCENKSNHLLAEAYIFFFTDRDLRCTCCTHAT